MHNIGCTHGHGHGGSACLFHEITCFVVACCDLGPVLDMFITEQMCHVGHGQNLGKPLSHFLEGWSSLHFHRHLYVCGKTWQYSALGQTFIATCVLPGTNSHSVAAIRHNIQCPYWAPHFREKRGRCHCWDSAVPQW